MATYTIKDRFNSFYNNTKSKAKKLYADAETRVKAYGSTIEKAYDVGYKSGWRDANFVGSDFGSITSAATGYGRGIKHRHRTIKYNKRINKK